MSKELKFTKQVIDEFMRPSVFGDRVYRLVNNFLTKNGYRNFGLIGQEEHDNLKRNIESLEDDTRGMKIKHDKIDERLEELQTTFENTNVNIQILQEILKECCPEIYNKYSEPSQSTTPIANRHLKVKISGRGTRTTHKNKSKKSRKSRK